MAAASMSRAPAVESTREPLRLLSSAPEELTSGKLRRLGEGIGKVVYASEHWVVKRERSRSEILGLITVWKFIRKVESTMPRWLSSRLLRHPGPQIRILRILAQPLVLIVPKSVWFMRHISDMWRTHRWRDIRGEKLANVYLAGTDIVPDRIAFPPVRVRVGGWPGWLTVSEAVERVDCTLLQRLESLAKQERFEGVEVWLDRLLRFRRSGWQRGLFSVDTHLNNYGVIGDRVVLLDLGGLTKDWAEIDSRLGYEESVKEPHVALGLASVLRSRPDVAARFNAQWKATVNREQVRLYFHATAPEQREGQTDSS